MRIGLVLAACFVLGGCASVTRGWSEDISLASTPEGAVATVSGNESHTCTTPCVVQVKRSSELQVSFEKPGYAPQVVVLTREVAPEGVAGFAGNVLIGGLIGMGVDAASGATMDHKPNPVIVTLRPSGKSLAPSGKSRPKRGSPTS